MKVPIPWAWYSIGLQFILINNPLFLELNKQMKTRLKNVPTTEINIIKKKQKEHKNVGLHEYIQLRKCI